MSQKIKIPKILKCIECGESADIVDWDNDFQYRVMCKNNHFKSKSCSTENKAIHLWNNRNKKQEEEKL